MRWALKARRRFVRAFSESGKRGTAGETKLSGHGSHDALFKECLDAIRQTKHKVSPNVDTVGSDVIFQLTQDELELTRKIFQRLDPEQKVTSRLSDHGHFVDPYWSPFTKADELKDRVTAEMDDLARTVSAADARRVRIQLQRQLRKAPRLYDPYTEEYRKKANRTVSETAPKPMRVDARFWERSPLQARIAKERITWRDPDILVHCLAENGYILPRRVTTLSSRKQLEMVKAVKWAQHMTTIPYGYKPKDYTLMPLMDPIQFFADRLTDRVIEKDDARARAMIAVLMEKYPQVNFKRFLLHEAKKEEAAEDERKAEKEEESGDFSRFLQRTREEHAAGW
jgi:ribosomal protein S18